MRTRKYSIYACDFETTVYEGQTDTQVWASALVKLYTEDVIIHHSINDTLDYLISLDENLICYYHNLKFDGSFWLSYLLLTMSQYGYKQAIDQTDPQHPEWLSDKDMPNKTYKYSISDMGQWYKFTIKVNDRIIELRDSLKLLPFTLERIGKAFHTKHKKLTMEYTGYRYPGCEITEEEKQYISNDVLVLKEALEITFEQGHTKLTIGSCCLSEYKSIIGKKVFEGLFPNVYEIALDQYYGAPNAGEYIRKSYRGGWCYLAKGKECKIYTNGTTADVNSLYPSQMHSSSGNYYPVGDPTFWKGDYVPDICLTANKYYFVRIRTRFYLRPGKLPTIQIKNTLRYKFTEYLETSDILDPKTGEYYSEYIGFDGQRHKATVELTLTMTDFKLIQDHYQLVDCEILDGCYFDAEIGLFDEYIDKYKEIKQNSTGAIRELAKLFLNNLYGKMASNTDSSFKLGYLKEDKSVGFTTVTQNDKMPGYIPVGSAITSYARNFTIRAAQQNYHGPDKPGFIYADTDSIHCDLPANQMQGIKVHDTEFNCWKLEGSWDIGWYVRQKTYIEHITQENLKPCEPYYAVKCAGMPDRCKQLFLKSMVGETDAETDEEKEFLSKQRTIEDFNVGLSIPGKLVPKRIRGGVLLVPTTYCMK